MIMASNYMSSAAGGASSQLGAGVHLPLPRPLPPHESTSSQIVQNQQQQLHHQNIASNNISFGVTRQSSSSSPSNLIIRNKDGGIGSGSGSGGNYDLGELDQAFFLYLDHQEGEGPSAIQEQKQNNNSGMRPPTLNIFPSQPMYVEPSPPKGMSGNMGGIVSSCAMPIMISSSSCSSSSTAIVGSNRSSNSTSTIMMDLSSSYSKTNLVFQPPPTKAIKREGSDIAPPPSNNNQQQQGPPPQDTTDPKTLRRLAQNREAARKSRIRKKIYVQQLESSRLKLTQLELQLQRSSTSSQGVYIGGGSAPIGLGGGSGGDQAINPIPLMPNITSEAGAFDMEYRRWVQENHQLTSELRNALMQTQEGRLHDHELRLYVTNYVAHFDELMALKRTILEKDVFHLLSGVWKTPAERSLMWLGGFRPFQLIKILTTQLSHVEALSEQQVIGICELQHSIHETEERLSQAFEVLNQSLSDTVVSDALAYPPDMPNYMAHMNVAINKLSTIQGYVRDADNVRQQAIHRLLQLLTPRQAAKCCMGMADYFNRLRAISSLWLAFPSNQDQP